jgi:hypothetical protein
MLRIEYPHGCAKKITYPVFQTVSIYIYDYYTFVNPWRPVFDPSSLPVDIWNEIAKYINSRDINHTRNVCKFYKRLQRKTLFSDLSVSLRKFLITFMDSKSTIKMKKTCKKVRDEISTTEIDILYVPINFDFYSRYWETGIGGLVWSNC